MNNYIKMIKLSFYYTIIKLETFRINIFQLLIIINYNYLKKIKQK